MTRRFIGFLVLGIWITAQAAPLAATGRQCRMDLPAVAALCGGCDVAGSPDRAATVSAGSCCRFEAASPRSAAPGVIPSLQRAHDSATAPLWMLAASGGDASPLLGSGRAHPSPPRSTDSPITRNNTLRL